MFNISKDDLERGLLKKDGRHCRDTKVESMGVIFPISFPSREKIFLWARIGQDGVNMART